MEKALDSTAAHFFLPPPLAKFSCFVLQLLSIKFSSKKLKTKVRWSGNHNIVYMYSGYSD